MLTHIWLVFLNTPLGSHFSAVGRVRLSDIEVQTVRDFVAQHKHDSLVDNAAALKEQKDIDISAAWLGYLAKTDPERLHPYSMQYKPELTAEHKQAREEFCEEHKDTHWAVYIWTDEFTIYPAGKNGKVICWARNKADVPRLRTKKFPPGFQVFAAFTREGVFQLRLVHGKLNSQSFTRLLDGLFKEIHAVRGGVQCILMHDNASIWTSKFTREFLAHHPLVMSKLITPLKGWPACSPDLNPIENLMAICKRAVRKRLAKLPASVERTCELYLEHLTVVWNKTARRTLQHLVDSLPKRCAECILRNGDATDS